MDQLLGDREHRQTHEVTCPVEDDTRPTVSKTVVLGAPFTSNLEARMENPLTDASAVSRKWWKFEDGVISGRQDNHPTGG